MTFLNCPCFHYYGIIIPWRLIMESLTKSIPVNELKNTSNILKMCKETNGPILITRNGYGEAVIMSTEYYEKLFDDIRIAVLINESLDNLKHGGKLYDGKQVMEELRKKYGGN